MLPKFSLVFHDVFRLRIHLVHKLYKLLSEFLSLFWIFYFLAMSYKVLNISSIFRYDQMIFLRIISHFEFHNIISVYRYWFYSTVTDFAKFLGWSTWHPLITAMWYASNCRGITDNNADKGSSISGISMIKSAISFFRKHFC